jgi:hypothetical protein
MQGIQVGKKIYSGQQGNVRVVLLENQRWFGAPQNHPISESFAVQFLHRKDV